MYRIYVMEPGHRDKTDYPRLFQKQAEAIAWAISLLPLHYGISHYLAVRDETSGRNIAYVEINASGDPEVIRPKQGAVINAAKFACSPEGRKRGSGAMSELKKAVKAHDEAQGHHVVEAEEMLICTKCLKAFFYDLGLPPEKQAEDAWHRIQGQCQPSQAIRNGLAAVNAAW